MDAKPLLRSRLRSARGRRGREELDRLGEQIAAIGMAHVADASVVAAYVSVGDEPPTRPLIDRLFEAGRTVLLPVVAPTGLGWGLHWGRYDGWDALVDRRGLLEPAAELHGDVADATVVFAPALAVDRAGHRLGRGGGHYDRALTGVPRDRIVAIVFSDEVLDVVPTESHDVPVGAVLTPDGLVVCG